NFCYIVKCHRENHGHHEHESYYGERDTDSLVAAMETLVASIPRYSSNMALADESNHSVETAKRPAPLTSGCRIEGFVRVKKVNTLSLLFLIEHYLQVVKTEIVSRRYSQELKLLEEYEYTAHSSLVHSVYVPVAKFHFEPSPMQVGIRCFINVNKI
ncbi:hypothetical protein BHE74_00051651, partial [Ensete ventricosum]